MKNINQLYEVYNEFLDRMESFFYFFLSPIEVYFSLL